MPKHILHQRLTQKILQFDECITISFKIDLKISVIFKTVKIEIPTRGNQNTHKREIKAPTNEEQTLKGTAKNTYKDNNKNKIKDTKC